MASTHFVRNSNTRSGDPGRLPQARQETHLPHPKCLHPLHHCHTSCFQQRHFRTIVREVTSVSIHLDEIRECAPHARLMARQSRMQQTQTFEAEPSQRHNTAEWQQQALSWYSCDNGSRLERNAKGSCGLSELPRTIPTVKEISTKWASKTRCSRCDILTVTKCIKHPETMTFEHESV